MHMWLRGPKQRSAKPYHRQFESGHVLMDNNEKEEILNTYKWIKVKKFVDDETKSWEERFKALEKHHLEETNFLINKTREIVKQI